MFFFIQSCLRFIGILYTSNCASSEELFLFVLCVGIDHVRFFKDIYAIAVKLHLHRQAAHCSTNSTVSSLTRLYFACLSCISKSVLWYCGKLCRKKTLLYAWIVSCKQDCVVSSFCVAEGKHCTTLSSLFLQLKWTPAFFVCITCSRLANFTKRKMQLQIGLQTFVWFLCCAVRLALAWLERPIFQSGWCYPLSTLSYHVRCTLHSACLVALDYIWLCPVRMSALQFLYATATPDYFPAGSLLMLLRWSQSTTIFQHWS